jgi:hypothetical protein
MAGQVTISPDQLTKNWQQGMTNNVKKIQDAVGRVTENPAQKAMAAKDKWVQGVQRAANEGRFEAGLSNVTLQDWKNNTIQKIGERMQGGVTAAGPKFQKFASYLISTVNAAKSVVDAMPNMTLNDSIQRAAAFMTYMSENPYKR